MKNLKKFLEFRSRGELIKYCKDHKIKITEEQIERLRRNFNKTFNTDKKLNIESLDKISGGMKSAVNEKFIAVTPKNQRIEVMVREFPTRHNFSELPGIVINVDAYKKIKAHFGDEFKSKTTLGDIAQFLTTSESEKAGVNPEDCVILIGLINSCGLPLQTLANGQFTPWSSQSRKTP